MKSLNNIKIKENYDKILKYFLFFLLFAQGLTIFLFNLFQTERYLFFDNALAIRHGIEMWRNGLFLDGYNYFSTMEIDNAAFFAVPLFFLTNNLGLSLAIVHLLLYILCVYLIYSIFKNGGYDTKYGLVAAFLLFTPYVIAGLDWGNMLFVTVGQYEFRVMVMLSVTNLLLMALNNKTEAKSFIPLHIFNILLCFWTTLSCGNYVILMILLPFCLFYIFMNCISDKVVINKQVIWILVSSVLVCVIALMIRNHTVGETGRASLPLLTADTFSANLLNCITGFFMLFGGLTQDPYTPIFSSKGMLQILKFVITVIYLVVTFIKLKKLKPTDYLPYMFIFVALVNWAVMTLSVTRYGAVIYEYRYHIVWAAMLILVAVASLEAIKYVRLQKITLLVIIVIAIIINYGGFNIMTSEITGHDFEKEIIEFANEEDLNTIYVYNMPNEASTIRVLDIEKSCMSVTYVVDHVYTSTDNYYEDYSSYYVYDERHLFICPRDCFEPLPEDIKSCYTEVGMIEDSCVFIGSMNPWLQ